MTPVDLDPSYWEPIDVVVPNPDCRRGQIFSKVHSEGTGIVRVPGRNLLYYEEPGIAQNVVNFADRVHVAHGRAWSDQLAPGATGRPSTHKIIGMIDADDFILVASYDPREGEIHLLDGGEMNPRTLLARHLSIDEEDLAGELVTVGNVRHEQRRALRKALAAGDFPREQLASVAASWGASDLLEDH